MTELRITPEWISTLAPNEVFVFGSNLQGRHGGGAAREAHAKFGAEWGVGVGPTGRCYAIPTMQGGVETIRPYVKQFLKYAKANPQTRFLLTRIGCGIAGFSDREMAMLFVGGEGCPNVMSLPNVTIPEQWLPYLISTRII